MSARKTAKPWVRPNGCKCDEAEPAKYKCSAKWTHCIGRAASTLLDEHDALEAGWVASEGDDGVSETALGRAIDAYDAATKAGETGS